jgi:hypothetical protein
MPKTSTAVLDPVITEDRRTVRRLTVESRAWWMMTGAALTMVLAAVAQLFAYGWHFTP